MTYTLLDAQPVVLISIAKPILMAVAVIAWASLMTMLDKDLEHFFLPRRSWNGVQIGAGLIGFALWLFIPLFLIGMLAALVCIGGAFLAYAAYRNKRVPARSRWSMSWESISNWWSQMQQDQAQRRATVSLLSAVGAVIEVPTGNHPQAKAHELLEELLEFALPRAAERVEIAVEAKRSSIRVEIDGVQYPQSEHESGEAMALIDYLKEHAGLDVSDRRRKLTGSIRVDTAESGKHTLGLTSFGSTRGFKLSIEVDPEARTWRSYDELGLLPAQKRQLESVLDEPNRLIIIATPPKQGLTTALYGIVQRHDPYTENVVTLEELIPFEVMGFGHRHIEPGTDGKDLAKGIEVLLRQDPQVLMITRANEPPVANVLTTAAQDVRVYAAMNQDDTFTTAVSWTKLIDDPHRAAQSLGAVVTGRLIRKLCTTCRIPYTPKREIVRKLNLPADRVGQFFKHSGKVRVKNQTKPCPTCMGLGFRGRVGIFEVMALDDQARSLLGEGKIDQLRGYLRGQQMLWMQEVALSKVVDGTTSISEVTRVFDQEGKKTVPQPKKGSELVGSGTDGSSAPPVS